jgi:hypothetical protein
MITTSTQIGAYTITPVNTQEKKDFGVLVFSEHGSRADIACWISDEGIFSEMLPHLEECAEKKDSLLTESVIESNSCEVDDILVAVNLVDFTFSITLSCGQLIAIFPEFKDAKDVCEYLTSTKVDQ